MERMYTSRGLLLRKYPVRRELYFSDVLCCYNANRNTQPLKPLCRLRTTDHLDQARLL